MVTAEFVIGAYRRLPGIEKASVCRIRSASPACLPLQARPTEAHLTVVFAALPVRQWIETTAGGSTKKSVRTARRYRAITIQVGAHAITAVGPGDGVTSLPERPGRERQRARGTLIRRRTSTAWFRDGAVSCKSRRSAPGAHECDDARLLARLDRLGARRGVRLRRLTGEHRGSACPTTNGRVSPIDPGRLVRES
jgi:hypothetical protein